MSQTGYGVAYALACRGHQARVAHTVGTGTRKWAKTQMARNSRHLAKLDLATQQQEQGPEVSDVPTPVLGAQFWAADMDDWCDLDSAAAIWLAEHDVEIVAEPVDIEVGLLGALPDYLLDQVRAANGDAHAIWATLEAPVSGVHREKRFAASIADDGDYDY